MADYRLNELVAAASAIATDIFHLRTVGGIDKKITLANLGLDQDVKTTASPSFVGVTALKSMIKQYNWASSDTENTVFDDLSPDLVLGVECICSGIFGTDVLMTIKLNTATTIDINWATTSGFGGGKSITNGSGSAMGSGGSISF